MNMTILRVLLALAFVACAAEQPEDTQTPVSAAAIVPAGSGVDQDCDGVSDELEPSRGMSATNPNDGRRDEDGDGLTGAQEARLGGNPMKADSDGDGEADTTDLLRGLDLDGDGVPTERDNCKSALNPGQRDLDRDGIGDACDDAPTGGSPLPFMVVHLAQHPTRRDFALIDASEGSEARKRPDLAGYLDTGTSVLLHRAVPGLKAVTELVHPTSLQHVYAAGDAELKRYRDQGFTVSFPFGAISETPPNYGTMVRARRFERTAGGNYEQVTTVSERDVAALIASGFRELGPLGWALTDEGRLRKPRVVTRFRRASDGATLHTMHAASEPLASTFAREGGKFQLLPEPNGWTAPVYRLRNAAGAEVLSTVEADAFALEARGYALEGVIGWVYREDPAVQNVLDTTPLVRLSNGARFEHSADPDEIASLKTRGFESATVLGRAVRMPPRARRGNGCVGDLGLADRIRQSAGDAATPAQLSLQALHTLSIVHTLNRLLNGRVESKIEQAVTQVLRDLTPAVRAKLRAHVAALAQISPSQRAALLGNLASQDPFASSGAVDFAAVRYTTMRMLTAMMAANGGGGGAGDPVFNGQVSATGLSFSKMRAPQCQGVTYAAPGTPEAAARAVTATIVTPNEQLVGAIYPGVFGVWLGSVIETDQPPVMLNYAKDHQKAGLPLIGIDVGPCQPSCPRALGQRCVADRCRQYPVVRGGAVPVFSGANFWDTLSARIHFTEADPDDRHDGRPLSFEADVGGVEPLSGPTEWAMRCDLNPVSQSPRIRGAADAPAACPAAGETPQCPADVSRNPAEQTLEFMQPKGGIQLEPERFYQVQVQNANGSYYAYNDLVSLDPAVRAAQGRTIHVCGGRCTAVNPVSAGCPVNPLPTCGGTVGGAWSVPPRPLVSCRAQDFDPPPCPETPHVFRSQNITQGLPRLVYVMKPDAPIIVQTKLEAVKCLDETGIDAFGPDELMVWFGSLSTEPFNPSDVRQLQGGFRALQMSMNSGNIKRPPNTPLVATTVLTRSPGSASDLVMIAMEDDDVDWDDIVGSVAVAVGVAAGTIITGGILAGVTVGLVIGGAVAGGGAFVKSLVDMSNSGNEDDNIGKVSWRVTLDGLTERSTRTHDSVFGTPATDPTPFPLLQVQDHVVSREAGRHPAVDGFTHDNNAQLVSCASATACTNGRICVQGACVPPQWTDPTLPLGTFKPSSDIPGVIERIHLRDEGSYLFWVSTSISDEDGRTVVTP